MGSEICIRDSNHSFLVAAAAAAAAAVAVAATVAAAAARCAFRFRLLMKFVKREICQKGNSFFLDIRTVLSLYVYFIFVIVLL